VERVTDGLSRPTWNAGRLRWRGVALILIASSFWPLSVMAANPASIARPERILAIVASVLLIGLASCRVLMSFGLRVGPAENTTFVWVLLLMTGGPVIEELELLAIPLLLIAAILAAWLFVRLEGQVIVSALVWATAVSVAAGPAVALFENLQSRGASAVLGSEPIPVDFPTTPDVFLVVFDGYPGRIASEQDGLAPGVVDVVTDLQSRGFQLPKSSWSTYWTTTLSIPSLLDMTYVVEREWSGLETVRDLQRIVSGDSNLMETLKANGYQTHMVESGWSGGTCGPGFDHCVPAPLLDEATYLTLQRTVAWAALADSPGPSIEGALAGFDWLEEYGPEIAKSDAPDFVFAHVVAPHPPMYLTPDCSLDLADSRGGSFFLLPGVPEQARAGYLVEQMDCMDRFMVGFADLIEPDDVVIYVSDHGSDRRNQNDPAYTDWDRATIVERMNNFLAVRLPGGCEIADGVVMPNVFRQVLACLSASHVETLPERMWVNPMRELTPSVVEGLLASSLPLE